MRRLLVLLVAALAVALAGVACGGGEVKLEKVSVALDWFPWSNHSGLFIAREKGYYRDEGLDVDIYTPSDPSAVLQTVGAGRDQFGISYQVEVLLARQQQVPVVSIAALVQHPLDSVMTLKSSGIERPGQLKGKKVGYPGIGYDEPLLETMLKQEGLSLTDVELVNVGYDLVPALIGKKVDAVVGAYWVHESIAAENQGYPVNIMRMEQWGVPDFYELVLVSSEKLIKDNPKLVERFVRATVLGYKDAVADPQKAVDALVKANPEVDQSIERPGVVLLAPLWTEGVPSFGWQTRERWVGFADWMKANSLLKPDVDASAAFTNKYVEAAR
ncbi:MAG: ABC transporter substrate-binding protein [Chloroflexota bacterium]|nr:ABC transporter substrate-binding protein [Chloroflexota bacterium]